MGVKATVYHGIAVRFTPASAPDLGIVEYNVAKDADTAFDSGVAAFQADTFWSDTRTLTTGATEDLDVRGVLKDVFGANFDPVKLVGIYFRSATANTTNLTIGNGTNPMQLGFGATTHTWVLTPGGVLLATAPNLAGWPSTAGTADIIKVANSAGASATYDVKLLGRLS